jgi:streptomycin 6-kinase
LSVDLIAITRLTQFVRRWNVDIKRVAETQTAWLAFGARRGDDVVVKVVKMKNDEWHGGATAAAFEAHGLVRVYDFAPGAVLMEQLTPGTSLVELVNACKDDSATDALADVINSMRGTTPPIAGFPSVFDWGTGFDRYRNRGDRQIPSELVDHAEQCYRSLCRTQNKPRLLHGDLQHYNVLSDRGRGWVAIDPKGVVGELEFEVAAFGRNPHGRPELYTASAVVRRIERIASALPIDVDRALAWTYSHAVLSAIWSIEDGEMMSSDLPALRVAHALRSSPDLRTT